LLVDSRREKKEENENLFNDNDADCRHLILVLSGEVTVIRTLDDVEVGRGKCSVGCYFGAFRSIMYPHGIAESEQETTVKEGGMGVNSCVINTNSVCEIVRIKVSNVLKVLPLVDSASIFVSKLLEKVARNVSNLDKLNRLVLQDLHIHDGTDSNINQDEWKRQKNQRIYHASVPEIQRQAIQEAFQNIQKLWHHLSRGANTAPKNCVELIKAFLGESGLECYNNIFVPMEEPTAPLFFDEDTFWFCWVNFLTRSLKQTIDIENTESEEDKGQDHYQNDDDTTDNLSENMNVKGSKGVITIIVKNAVNLLPMDFETGHADPYIRVTVDGVLHQTKVSTRTRDPIWNTTMEFNAVANRSIVHVEIFHDVVSEEEGEGAIGTDPSMGACSFLVVADPSGILGKTMTHMLTGQLSDGRSAQGNVSIQSSFTQGKAVGFEQKSEFQVFCETENYRALIMSWLYPSRRIETSFFQVPLPVHEREFAKAAGNLSKPLSGLAIKQYLTYTLVSESSHQVDVYGCREFCNFLKRKFDAETSIAYRDIVKLVKERNSASGVNKKDFFIGKSSVMNPQHWMFSRWRTFVRFISLYHLFVVPVRIGFCHLLMRTAGIDTLPVFTSPLELWTDLPADLVIFLHVALSFHVSYKNSKSQWVVSRIRIFKNTDWVAVLGMLPLDWFVFLSGMGPETAVWCRVNKMLLLFSSISPNTLIFSTRGVGIAHLSIIFIIIWHICACVYFYMGRKAQLWDLGAMNQASWLFPEGLEFADMHRRGGSGPEETELIPSSIQNFGMRSDSSGPEQYILCMYVVLCSITGGGLPGPTTPTNFIEMLYTMIILIFNLTLWRWIQGEIADTFMSLDDFVIRTREEHEKVLRFLSEPAFKSDLRERIQAHFAAIQGNVSEEEHLVLSSLSHGLRVELSRLVWREFLGRVHLFRGCTGPFLDAVCVLVQEMHFGPEQVMGTAGEITDVLFILVHGGLETCNNGSSKSKKISRKGHSVGALSFLFAVRQYVSTRASTSGAVCIVLKGEGMREVMQIYPKDEEHVRKNALNFYFKEASRTEGTVTFSLSNSNVSKNGSDDSMSDGGKSTASKSTNKSSSSEKSNKSRASNASKVSKNSKKSSASRNSKISRASRDSKKKMKSSSKGNGGEEVKVLSGMSNGGLSFDMDEADQGNDVANLPDDENMPLMKEIDHVPILKDRLMRQKVVQMLTAVARGDMSHVEAIVAAGDITLSSKDHLGRTALHVAASEGHVRLVQYLLEKKADPSAKDHFGNTPFNDAVRSKHDAVAAIVKKFDPNISFKLPGNEAGVLMCQASFEGKLDDIKRLVANGVDPNESDYDGY
jgi:hypothetical protein